MTPAYLASEWTEFENIMVQTLDPAARQRRLLPLLLETCDVPLRLRTLTHLDMTREKARASSLPRLVAVIQAP